MRPGSSDGFGSPDDSHEILDEGILRRVNAEMSRDMTQSQKQALEINNRATFQALEEVIKKTGVVALAAKSEPAPWEPQLSYQDKSVKDITDKQLVKLIKQAKDRVMTATNFCAGTTRVPKPQPQKDPNNLFSNQSSASPAPLESDQE